MVLEAKIFIYNMIIPTCMTTYVQHTKYIMCALIYVPPHEGRFILMDLCVQMVPIGC